MSKKKNKHKKAKKKQQLKAQNKTQKQAVVSQKATPKKSVVKKATPKKTAPVKAAVKSNQSAEEIYKQLEREIKREEREKARKKMQEKANSMKHKLVSFEDKKWSVGIILAALVLAFTLQGVIEDQINPQVAQANIVSLGSTALEAYSIGNKVKVYQPNKRKSSYAISPGGTEETVFRFSVKSFDENLVFKELKIIKEGDLPDYHLLQAHLFEGDTAISTARIKKGVFYFKDFTSSLQPQTEKEYIIKVDTAHDAILTSRFRLRIDSPQNLVILANDQPVYELDKYPILGAYATVVGWRK